ncbi:hypothetical protein RABR111495_01420 [Rahnella bruchi]
MCRLCPRKFINELFSDIGKVKLGNAHLPYKYVNQVLAEKITKIRADLLCTVSQITVQRMNSRGRISPKVRSEEANGTEWQKKEHQF